MQNLVRGETRVLRETNKTSSQLAGCPDDINGASPGTANRASLATEISPLRHTADFSPLPLSASCVAPTKRPSAASQRDSR